MLVIRASQMKVFEDAALRRFEDEMVQHSQRFSPRLCKVIGEAQLRLALRQAMHRAGGYGFTFRGPLRLFIEMMFLFGSAFDTDPQYPWTTAILQAPEDQMGRAEQLRAKTLDFQEKVAGPEGANTRQALENLEVWCRKPLPASADDLEEDLLRAMHDAFPEKAAYVGDARLRTLIRKGRAEAQVHRFPLRGEMVVVVVMYAFGHGCLNDPLYPWMASTLQDARIISPAARAERLEKKAMTWLESVLARNKEGAPT